MQRGQRDKTLTGINRTPICMRHAMAGTNTNLHLPKRVAVIGANTPSLGMQAGCWAHLVSELRENIKQMKRLHSSDLSFPTFRRVGWVKNTNKKQRTQESHSWCSITTAYQLAHQSAEAEAELGNWQAKLQNQHPF